MTRATRNLVVSSEEERLILVDSDDRETGTSSKSECHDGAGILHRAFSLFVFNRAGELLIHQRHPSKRLWPGLLVEQLLQPSARRGRGRSRHSPSARTGTRPQRQSRVRLQVRIHRAVRRRRHRTRTVLGLRRHHRRRAAGEHDRGRELALDRSVRTRRGTRRDTATLHAVVQTRVAGAARHTSKTTRSDRLHALVA